MITIISGFTKNGSSRFEQFPMQDIEHLERAITQRVHYVYDLIAVPHLKVHGQR